MVITGTNTHHTHDQKLTKKKDPKIIFDDAKTVATKHTADNNNNSSPPKKDYATFSTEAMDAAHRPRPIPPPPDQEPGPDNILDISSLTTTD